MDGNGRWAKRSGMPRIAGHTEGVESVRDTVEACGQLGVRYLTLYAFSTENWKRPKEEVSLLMRLLLKALRDETDRLHTNNVRIKTIGDIAALPEEIKPFLARGEAVRKDRIATFPLYRLRVGAQELILLQSGMGPKNAESATRALLDTTTPDLIINFGLAGAVAPGPQIADLVVAIRLLVSDRGTFSAQSGLDLPLVDAVMANIGTSRCHPGTFITTAETTPKATLRETLPVVTETPVLEMETAAIARVADERGNPLLAIRADLKTLAVGFYELSLKLLPPPLPPPMNVAEAPVPAPPVPRAAKLYSADDRNVVPPVPVRQQIPAYPGRVSAARTGVLELVIDNTGAVESATMRVSVNAQYDRLATSAARTWQYQPATIDGAPVKFLKRIQVSLVPTP